MARKAGLLKQLGEFGKNFKAGFKDDVGIGPEDARGAGYIERELQGKQREAPKMEQMVHGHHLLNRIAEAVGKAAPERVQAHKELGMQLKPEKGPGYVPGQIGGAVAGDLAQDGTRRYWWLLNALQATGEVINEAVLARANRIANLGEKYNLYGKHDVLNDLSGDVLRVKNKNQAIAQGVVKEIDGKVVPQRGYSIAGEGDDKYYQQRNFEPGDLALLSIPTGVAINSGLGLLTPFGGAEGYKAAMPSKEDPTKAENVLGEVALKYFMGRTGNLLPYDEFSKVRPDVSKEEYDRYQAFKYDKREDWNPLDGDTTMLAGAIKATNEGIHGPELQFLGRSLPVTTGVIPYASALIGGASGVMTKRPIKQGGIRGMAGLAAGQVMGNLIEGERRRRNKEENERDTMGQYGRES